MLATAMLAMATLMVTAIRAAQQLAPMPLPTLAALIPLADRLTMQEGTVRVVRAVPAGRAEALAFEPSPSPNWLTAI